MKSADLIHIIALRLSSRLLGQLSPQASLRQVWYCAKLTAQRAEPTVSKNGKIVSGKFTEKIGEAIVHSDYEEARKSRKKMDQLYSYFMISTS